MSVPNVVGVICVSDGQTLVDLTWNDYTISVKKHANSDEEFEFKFSNNVLKSSKTNKILDGDRV